jgi:hypothetical protein
VQSCRRTFKKEFSVLLHKVKPSLLPAMEAWFWISNLSSSFCNCPTPSPWLLLF